MGGEGVAAANIIRAKGRARVRRDIQLHWQYGIVHLPDPIAGSTGSHRLASSSKGLKYLSEPLHG